MLATVYPRQPNRTKNNIFCLFCEKPVSASDSLLYEAMTKMVSERVKRCVTKILDECLLEKVSSGDLVTNEARYHTKCLVTLYNAAARSKTSDRRKLRLGTKSNIVHCLRDAFEQDSSVVVADVVLDDLQMWTCYSREHLKHSKTMPKMFSFICSVAVWQGPKGWT